MSQPGREECPPRLLRALLLAVMLDVAFGRLLSVVAGVKVMPVRDMGMMRRLFVRPDLMVLRGLLVMTGGMFEVFGRFRVMFRRLLGHTCLR